MLYNHSQPAGYAAEPVETVNYAGCHDGEIIFDQLIMKPADQVTEEPFDAASHAVLSLRGLGPLLYTPTLAQNQVPGDTEKLADTAPSLTSPACSSSCRLLYGWLGASSYMSTHLI